MGVFGAEQKLCPCYKECQKFHKLVELKDTGLVVYCHSTPEDVRHGEVVENAVDTSRDVFILHNTKDVKITPSELTSELEKKDISCPRCKKIFEHAQELLKRVTSIDRKNVLGVCDHCRKKAQAIKKPCYACEEIVKKFISVKSQQKEDTKEYIKIWLSKMGHLLKDAITLGQPKKIKTRTYSDLQINRFSLRSPASRHEPEVQQMYSGTHKSDTNLYAVMGDADLKERKLEQSVAFIQPIEQVETSFAVTPYEGGELDTITPGPSLVESDITFVDTYVGAKELPKTSLKDFTQEEVFTFYDDPSMDAKEAIKKRHDLSLRHIMRSKEDFEAPYSVSKRPEIYEIPKIAPWEQKEPTYKYQDSETDIPVKHGSSRTSQKYLRDPYSKQYRVDKYDDGKIKMGMYDSEESLKSAQNIIKAQYSFFFPKEKEEEGMQIKVGKPSSELIKDVHEKLRLQAEFERKQHEEELKQKLEEQKKKLAQEEKKLQAEEKKKQAEEDQQKSAKDQKRLSESKKHSEKDLGSKALSEEEEEKHDKPKTDKFKEDKSKKDREKREIGSISEATLKGKKTKDSDVAKKDKLDKETERDKKDLPKPKPEQSDKIYKSDKETGRDKKDLSKPKPEQSDKIYKLDKETGRGKKDLSKPKPEQSDKIYEVLEKTKKDMKSKPEGQGDEFDEVSEKTKKGIKGEFETKEKSAKVTGKGKKSLKETPEPKFKDDELIAEGMKSLKESRESRGKDDKETEKSKKGLKGKLESKDKGEVKEKVKSDQGDKFDEVSGKAKRDIKSIIELKEKSDIVTEKGKKSLKETPETKNKDDQLMVKIMKGLKGRRDSRGKDDKETEKSKKGLKGKPGSKDKDEVTEKVKIDLNLKSDSGDKILFKLKSEQKDKTRMEKEKNLKTENKDTEKKMPLLRNMEELLTKTKIESSKAKESPLKKGEMPKKEELTNLESDHEDKIHFKLKPEEKDKTRMEKEKNLKNENKETEKKMPLLLDELLAKKRIESSKAKESPRKKGEMPKKEELTAKKREFPVETEVSTSKKQSSNKEKKEPSIKEQDLVKVKKGKKEEESKDVEEPSKKKQETTKEYVGKEKEPQSIASSKEGFPKVSKEEASKRAAEEAQFRKLQEQHSQEKEKALIQKKQQEIEAQKAKELKIRDIKIRSTSLDDTVLKLVQTPKKTKMKPWNVDPEIIKAHKGYHHYKTELSTLNCALCLDSELEMDTESYYDKINKTEEITDIIIGEKIFKYKPRLEKNKESEVVPILFQSEFLGSERESTVIVPQKTEPVKEQQKDAKGVDPISTKGIIRYALSDRTFIDKGWTMLPTEKVVRKMNVYRMRPAHPEFDWFKHNKNKRLISYDTGERLAEFDDNGRGRWYYRNGRLALDYYDAEEVNAQQRFVIYSSGEPDERGRTHPVTILATFDYLGNGIVFDHAGKIRLKYNQTEGVVLDRGIGPVSHWKWHTLNDPPVLQQVMIDTQMAHKDPNILKLGPAADTKTRPDNEEMLAIEFDNFIKEKSKKLSQKFKPFQIKMKALKINEHFSLKVLDQATVYLIFRDGSTNLKLNIGMILDHQEIVDTDTAEVGEVSNSLERFPARTDSLAGLQRSVAYAQRYERQRTERDRRLRHPEPCLSADLLTAAASPPLRPPLRTVPTGSSMSSAGYCSCRKPSNNLYYNTRLL